jgi:hypothetical protein
MPRVNSNYYREEADDSTVKAEVSSLLETPITPQLILFFVMTGFFLYYGGMWAGTKLMNAIRRGILLPEDPAGQKVLVKSLLKAKDAIQTKGASPKKALASDAVEPSSKAD